MYIHVHVHTCTYTCSFNKPFSALTVCTKICGMECIHEDGDFTSGIFKVYTNWHTFVYNVCIQVNAEVRTCVCVSIIHLYVSSKNSNHFWSPNVVLRDACSPARQPFCHWNYYLLLHRRGKSEANFQSTWLCVCVCVKRTRTMGRCKSALIIITSGIWDSFSHSTVPTFAFARAHSLHITV
jgi:hypothetical protein